MKEADAYRELLVEVKDDLIALQNALAGGISVSYAQARLCQLQEQIGRVLRKNSVAPEENGVRC